MRIVHFEDLLFEKVDINDIITKFREKAYQFSIKWDGAPAFVTGHENGRFFVAFKNGYHRKEKQLFFSKEEIFERIETAELASKMAALFDAFESIEEGMILEGDFLFTDDMVKDREFQPNTVRYRSKDFHDIGYETDFSWRLGVVVHTVNGKPDAYFHKRIMIENDVLFVNPSANPTYDPIHIDPVTPCNFLTSTQKETFKKWVNSKVRAGSFDLNLSGLHEYEPKLTQSDVSYHQWTTLISDYMRLAHWKNDVLTTVTSDNVIEPVYGHFHEGLVIDIGDRLVKMVDRLKFSFVNFNKER